MSSPSSLPPVPPTQTTESGIPSNPQAIHKIRDAWISKQLTLRQASFTNYSPLSVVCATYNVNAKSFKDDGVGKGKAGLIDWLFPAGVKNSCGNPGGDIIAVGFQEIVDLNAVNVAVDSKATQRSIAWQEELSAVLAKGGAPAGDEYVLISEKHLVGMLICVYVRIKHAPQVKHVKTDSVGVGVMGVMGNKGGVSVRCQVYDSTMCFTCSHFAAHRENVVGRNADFHSICNKTSFAIGEQAVKDSVSAGSLSQWATGGTIGLMDHDFVFWLGDLNYRIDESLTTDEVFEKTSGGNISNLLTHDQLNVERAANNVFQQFNEGKINFLPTYKYQPGTDLYECRPEKKLRAPAWCDRVLWSSLNEDHVQQTVYTRSELDISDHKPVVAGFAAKMKSIIPSKRNEVHAEIMRTLDKFENQSLPKVDLSQIGVDFGEVFYDR